MCTRIRLNGLVKPGKAWLSFQARVLPLGERRVIDVFSDTIFFNNHWEVEPSLSSQFEVKSSAREIEKTNLLLPVLYLGSIVAVELKLKYGVRLP